MSPDKTQALRYLQFLHNIFVNGTTVSPRGLEIKEVEDTILTVDPRFPFMTFKARAYNVDYFKKEMCWKLTADRYNDSIKQHAKMWSEVQNPDGSFNSNYGQYWWGPQQGMKHVVDELIRDPMSRRAVIPMLNASHLGPDVRDTVCTECIGFRLRPDYRLDMYKPKPGVVTAINEPLYLNMTVHMRSSDVIFGLGTDIPTFAFLYRLVFGSLINRVHHPINIGTITILAMSSHIYARHYDRVVNILADGVQGYTPEVMPWVSRDIVSEIIASKGDEKILRDLKGLGEWLCR